MSIYGELRDRWFAEPPHDRGRRSPVFAAGGMVATSQPLATQAGLEILSRGGTAADAAVAAAAALNVTEPGSTGLGGDAFALYYDARERAVYALNGSGKAPAALTLDRIHREGFTEEHPWQPLNPLTVTVPGACAAWVDTNRRFGALEMREILLPAIRLARQGFPVAPLTAHFWALGARKQLYNNIGGDQLLVGGRAPAPGELFSNPGLADVLEAIATDGAAPFYTGWIAERIEEAVGKAGGVLTGQDLAEHHSTWETPIGTEYRGLRVWECPPNGQGITALLALNILRQVPEFQEAWEASADPASEDRRLHIMIEALRLAFADTRWYVADPAHSDVPVDDLLSEAYAARRADLIDPDGKRAEITRGVPTAGSDTVYLCAVDGKGNACSFINSNYMGFGTGIVPDGTGFALQNRGHNFSLHQDHPNVVEPGKRPYHTIIPGMLTDDDSGALVGPFGVMGGFMQPQGHVQVVVNLSNRGEDPQTALDRRRFCIQDGTSQGRIALEADQTDPVFTALAERGHPLEAVGGYGRAILGRGQIILRDPVTEVLTGGSDPRADGQAAGL